MNRTDLSADLSAPPRDRGGFALAEVLVAMVILAIGLLGLESMAIGASRMIKQAELATEYTLLGSQRMEQTLTDARIAAVAPGSGTEQLPNGTVVDWVVVSNQIVPTTTQLYRVTVTVTPPANLATRVRIDPIILTGQAVRGGP